MLEWCNDDCEVVAVHMKVGKTRMVIASVYERHATDVGKASKNADGLKPPGRKQEAILLGNRRRLQCGSHDVGISECSFGSKR